jgi:hypothetical protein
MCIKPLDVFSQVTDVVSFCKGLFLCVSLNVAFTAITSNSLIFHCNCLISSLSHPVYFSFQIQYFSPLELHLGYFLCCTFLSCSCFPLYSGIYKIFRTSFKWLCHHFFYLRIYFCCVIFKNWL